ncbi:peptidoglycan-binding domain-containing protein [Actinomadura scrupuli]|uniref:peptidoglycan-binding domain-containing protein n=1 Tax=Actinomadura scrupuli TaxID=559629 RepID=UPI003D96706F
METPVSELDPAQTSTVDTAVFAAGDKILGVQRVVGASRPVASATVPGNARVLSRASVGRAGAGTRTVIVTSTADEWGPGLTVASWTERSGVNYQLVSRDAVGAADLLKIAQTLPRDSSTVSATTASRIAEAKPAATADVDGVVKGSPAPGAAQRSTTNFNVDGSGTVTDDWANEANLCAGCAYSSGNYAGMWQLVLYADNKLAWSGIDCAFGSGTASATRSWQSSEGLASDGVVGANTRGRADNYLSGNSSVTYWGIYDAVAFTRSTSSYYYYYGGTRLSYGFAAGAISPC